MKPAPAFDCADCGRRIGKAGTHVILADVRVVCIRHYDEYDGAGRIAHGFCTRAGAADLLGLWPADGQPVQP